MAGTEARLTKKPAATFYVFLLGIEQGAEALSMSPKAKRQDANFT
jgi:hypothetical protein